MLRPIKVEVPRSVARQFRELSKRQFPKEAFAVLIGRSAGTIVEVEELWIPDDLDEHTSTLEVRVQLDWWKDANKAAKELGLEIVGDIHSHCYELAELTGICQVTENKQRERRARIRFWGPQIEVRAKYVTRG